MNTQANSQQKKRVPSYANDNVLESLRGVGSSVGKTLTKDVAGKIGSDILQSILGGSSGQGGELKPNQAIDINAQKEALVEQKTAFRPRPEFKRSEYGQSLLREDEIKVRQQIEAVRKELQTLAASVKKLNQEIHTAVTETPVAVGVYHLNFFEHLKTVLKSLREQVEDSRTWLSAFMTRKKKMGYWGMLKKHGTSFGMSNERAIATQAG